MIINLQSPLSVALVISGLHEVRLIQLDCLQHWTATVILTHSHVVSINFVWLCPLQLQTYPIPLPLPLHMHARVHTHPHTHTLPLPVKEPPVLPSCDRVLFCSFYQCHPACADRVVPVTMALFSLTTPKGCGPASCPLTLGTSDYSPLQMWIWPV